MQSGKISVIYYAVDGQLRADLSISEIPALLEAGAGLLWVDFENTPPETDEPLLRDVFHFHPLAVDDALQEAHIPKVDDWGEYLYIVVHAVTFNLQQDSQIDTQELDIFLGRNYVVTHHDLPVPAIDKVRNALLRDDRRLRNGGDHLLYRLVDEITASYMQVVDEIDDAVDKAEDEVFDRPGSRTLQNIFALKRAVLTLRRMLGPLREVLNKLARDDYEVIDTHDQVYFRDVYDHLVRLYDIVESIRDLVGGTLDTYLSVINNRMNDIMKTLTVITTLFMPISFVAGFFGMNFFQPVVALDPWTSWPAFLFILFVMAAIPAGMYLFMRRRGWM